MATLKQQQHQKNCEISFLRRLFGLITALLLLRFSFGQKKNETNKKQSEKTHKWISCKGITLLTLDRLLWLFVDFNRGLQFILNPPSLPSNIIVICFVKAIPKINTYEPCIVTNLGFNYGSITATTAAAWTTTDKLIT